MIAPRCSAFLELAAALREMGDDAPEHLRAFDADRESEELPDGMEGARGAPL